MEIAITIIIALIVAFFWIGRWSSHQLHKLNSQDFIEWLSEYNSSFNRPMRRASMAKSLITDVLILAKQYGAFKNSDLIELEAMYNDLEPKLIIECVDIWIEKFLPSVLLELPYEVVEKSSARYVGMLMLIANTSISPTSGIRRFLDRTRG